MEKNLFQKHEEIAASLSDTVERVVNELLVQVEPLVERVANLEMENESRKKYEANSCSLVAELVEKVDKMSVTVSCLAKDTDGFRSDVEQKIKAIRDDMKAEMAEHDKKQDATSFQLKTMAVRKMTALKKDMHEKMEICVGMEDRVLVRIENDFNHSQKMILIMDKRIQDLLKRTRELA